MSVYSPKTLAAEWGCCANHVRNLVKSGELKGFRLGDKLLRIRAEDVRDYECRTRLGSSTESSSSSTETAVDGDTDIVSALLTRERLERLRRQSTQS